MAVTPSATSRSSARSITPSSTPRRTRPSASVRSGTSMTRARGTSGAGSSEKKLNTSGMRWRPMLRTSRKPSVMNRAARAPLRSMIVFTASVVPCTNAPIAAGSAPCSRASVSTPVKTDADGRSGVEGSFRTVRAPEASSRSAKSVKVPPMSTPRRRRLMPSPGAGRPVARRRAALRSGGSAGSRRPRSSDPAATRSARRCALAA